MKEIVEASAALQLAYERARRDGNQQAAERLRHAAEWTMHALSSARKRVIEVEVTS